MSELGDVLEAAVLPDSSAARERVVRSVHAAAQQPVREQEAARRRVDWRAGLGVVFATLLVASPPGQAAVDWAAELAGIGEVGDVASLPQRNDLVEPTSDRVIFATGRAPDGQPFEVVAYRGSGAARDQVDAFTSICVSLELPLIVDPDKRRFGEVCVAPDHSPSGVHIDGVSFRSPADAGSSNTVLSGSADPRADTIIVTYRDDQGVERRARAATALLGGELGKRIGVEEPSVYFFAFLEDAGSHDRFADYDPQVVARDTDGEVVGSDDLSELIEARQEDAALRAELCERNPEFCD